jgi:hypothetical protein
MSEHRKRALEAINKPAAYEIRTKVKVDFHEM